MSTQSFMPSSGDPLFVGALTVHIIAGIAAVAAGATAAFARKGGKIHHRAGWTFVWGLVGVLTTMAVMVALRWEHNAHLVPIGLVAGAAATVGILDRRRSRARRRDRVHVVAMGTAYIALLTGFYVDNGPNLPVWNLLPGWAFLLLPSAIGYPMIAWALRPGARRRGALDSEGVRR